MGKQEYAPVKHLKLKILMADEYCGQQPVQRKGLAASAYSKNEGTIPHPETRMHSLQYDWRPDWHFKLTTGMWNIGTIRQKKRERVKKEDDWCVVLAGEMPLISIHFAYRKCKWNIAEAKKQKKCCEIKCKQEENLHILVTL